MQQVANRGFSDHLLSLRGIAALMVLIFHATAVFAIDGIQPDDRMHGLPTAGTGAALARQWIFFMVNGHAAVTFFFVHSGFVLTLALSRSQPKNLELSYIGYIAGYYVKRLFRLWPMLIVSCMALWAYHRLDVVSTSNELFSVVFRNAVLTANQTTSLTRNILLEVADLNPFQWSIAIEVICSLLMPFLFLFGRLAFRTYCLLTVIYVATVILPLGQPITTLDTVPVEAARVEYVFCMVIGSFLVFAYKPLQLIFRLTSSTYLVGGAIIALLLARWFIPDFRSAVIIEIVAAAIIVYAVYYFDTGPLQSLCNLRIVKFYGLISYSFYSNSILSIRFAGPLVIRILGEDVVRHHGLLVTITCIILALIINTVLSWLTYLMIERPMTACGRQISNVVMQRYAGKPQEVEATP